MPEEIIIQEPGVKATIELLAPVFNQEIIIDNETIDTSIEVLNESFDSTIEITDQAPVSIEFVFSEVPEGEMNGANATFHTEYDFKPESLKVRVNGLQQVVIADYQILNTKTFILNISPDATDYIEVDYLKL